MSNLRSSRPVANIVRELVSNYQSSFMTMCNNDVLHPDGRGAILLEVTSANRQSWQGRLWTTARPCADGA
jgi:hypothetical protein